MALKFYEYIWKDTYRKSSSVWLNSGSEILTGGSTGYTTFLGINTNEIKEMLNTSTTEPKVFLNMYAPTNFGLTTLGFHKEGAGSGSGTIKAFEPTNKQVSLARYENRYEITNAIILSAPSLDTFKKIVNDGGYLGIVVYGELGDSFSNIVGTAVDATKFTIEIEGDWAVPPSDRMQPRSTAGYFGLDISSFQIIVDAPKFFQKSPHFNYFRAYGSNHSGTGDTSFLNFVALAKQYGVPSGAYYFGTPRKPVNPGTIQSEAREEADQFIAKLQEAYGTGRYGDLIPMLDIEEYKDLRTSTNGYPKASGMTSNELLQWILEFRNYFKAQTGRAVGFYSNRYFMQDPTQMALSDAQMIQLYIMPLWLAEYDRYYPGNPANGPARWAGWNDYNVWQYEVINDASTYGLAAGDVDHDFTTDLQLIKPPPPSTNIGITQLSNTTLEIAFTPPTTSDYIGSDIYVDNIWKAWLVKGTNKKVITVTAVEGQLVKINVVSQDKWQDTTWSADTFYRMVDSEAPVPPPIPEEIVYAFTEQEIRDMLHFKKGSRAIRFRYDLLDKNEVKIREMGNVLNGEVSMNAFNTIRRTAKFEIREDENEPINYLSDRIQPFVELNLPDKWVQNVEGKRTLVQGKWIEYPLGVFILSSPVKVEHGSYIYREIDAYDKTVILEEDKYVVRSRFLKGTKYIDAIIQVLGSAGITKYNFTPSNSLMRSDTEYEPGTPKSKTISDFLNAINYRPLWVDEFGYFTSEPYVSPQDRDPDYTYDITEDSVVSIGMEEELDLYSVPNSWVAYYSDADLVGEVGATVTLRSTYTNTNPASVTSTVSRGRTIVDYRKLDEIADQSALDAYVERIAFQSSQIFGKVRFTTPIMPFHGFQDVLLLRNDTLGIDGKYSETAWSIKLKTGSLMTHEVRIVMQI